MRIPAVGGRERSIYNTIPTAGRNGVKPVPATLRLESDALATQGQIQFFIKQNDGNFTQHITERRLQITDTFTCTEIGLFLLKVTTAGATQSGVLRTYPNSIEFSGGSGAEVAAMRGIYNGFLNITIDGVNYLPQSWDMFRHLYVPTAQNAVLTAASGTNNAYVAEGYDNSQKGFYPVTPNIVFKGSSNNLISINLPTSLAMAGTTSTNYAVLMMRGFLQQSSTNVVG